MTSHGIDPGTGLTLNGYRVFVSNVLTQVPRMQLSADCPVTPAYRAETNEWMRQFFGVKEIAFINERDGAVFLSERAFRELMKQNEHHVFKP